MRKVGVVSLLIMAAILIAIAFPAAAGSKSPVATVSPMAAVPAAAAAMPQGPRPHIHEALETMRAARHHLESAVGDFHGHRAKAIEHLNRAIHDAEICEHEP